MIILLLYCAVSRCIFSIRIILLLYWTVSEYIFNVVIIVRDLLLLVGSSTAVSFALSSVDAFVVSFCSASSSLSCRMMSLYFSAHLQYRLHRLQLSSTLSSSLHFQHHHYHHHHLRSSSLIFSITITSDLLLLIFSITITSDLLLVIFTR